MIGVLHKEQALLGEAPGEPGTRAGQGVDGVVRLPAIAEMAEGGDKVCVGPEMSVGIWVARRAQRAASSNPLRNRWASER